MVLVDVGPWGRVLDLYPHEGQTPELREAALILKGDYESALDRGVLRVSNEVRTVLLDVIEREGGNQHNVLKNLESLAKIFPEAGLTPVGHYSAGASKIHRQNLHLPGDNRVRLVVPQVQAKDFPEKVDGRIMFSSSEFDGLDSPQWQWIRSLADLGHEFYWNPGARQVKGGLISETRRALENQASIFQVNEEENLMWRRSYGHLPQADWTVTTLGSGGAELRIKGDDFHFPVVGIDRANLILGEQWSPHPVGCGDAFLASLIAVREVHEGVCPRWAGSFASFMASIQFQHSGSNLSAIVDRLVERRDKIPYDLGNGISRRAVI